MMSPPCRPCRWQNSGQSGRGATAPLPGTGLLTFFAVFSPGVSKPMYTAGSMMQPDACLGTIKARFVSQPPPACALPGNGREGVTHGDIPFRCGAVAHILNNRIYLGEIVHKGKAHPGEHEAIIDRGLFESVQARLAANRQKRVTRKARSAASPLTGKLFDQDGQPMRPSFGYGRGKKMYRYYISETLLPNGQIGNTDNMSGKRISAERLERLLLDRFSPLLPGGGCPDDLFDIIANARFIDQRMQIALDASVLMADGLCADVLLGRAQQHVDPSAKIEGTELTVSIDARPLRRGRTVRPRADLLDNCEQREVLADLVRTAHRKLVELNASPLHPEEHAQMKVAANDWTRTRIVIGLLAPDIQKAILQGTAPKGLDPDVLLDRDFPLDWGAQRRILGMPV